MRYIGIGAAVLLLIGALAYFLHSNDGLSETRAAILGTWVSAQDAKFTRVFNEDGTMTDSYGGTPDQKGYWTLFTKDMPPEGFDGKLDAGIYLALGMPETETLYFKVVTASQDTLEISYLNRGGVLAFKRQ